MRIKIIGENETARALRGLLRQAGFAVTEFLPADAVTAAPIAGYVVRIEDTPGQHILFDSVDCELEAAIVRHVTQLSALAVIVDRPGGEVHSDREIRIAVPRDPQQQTAVEFGVLRGLLDVVHGQGEKPMILPMPPSRRAGPWWKRILALGVLLGCALSSQAGPQSEAITRSAGLRVMVSGVESITLRGAGREGAHLSITLPLDILAQLQQSGSASAVNLSQVGGTAISSTLYDSANTALKVNCVVGCTASAGFTDNTAFTAGASSISNIGGVFNDALAAVASGNSAAPRITSNRGLHVNFRNAAGAEMASSTAAPAGTELGLIVRNIPSGTQAVSGAVTANAGTGTFTVGGSVTSNQGGAPWTQRIQDGVGATLATVTAANALKVDGSAVTQPVSGSVTANAGTGTFTVGGTLSANQGTAAALSGAWPTKPTDGTNSISVKAASTAAAAADTSLVVGLSPNSPLPAGANSIGTVVATQATAALLNVRDEASGATAAAVPARATYLGGNGSGNLTGLVTCDSSVVYDAATAGSTQLVALIAAKKIFVCGFVLFSAGATSVKLTSGTGAACATGPVNRTPAFQLTAQTGASYGNGSGVVLATAAGEALCINSSAAIAVQALVTYTQF